MVEPTDLPQEAVELPELILFPAVERVVVTLRALDLQAQQQAGGPAVASTA